MSDLLVLRIVTKILMPFILLFALYVQFHGDYGPGGGFQAGVIFGAGFILYGLVYGLDALRGALSSDVLRAGFALGLLIFAGVGVAGLLLGGKLSRLQRARHGSGQGPASRHPADRVRRRPHRRLGDDLDLLLLRRAGTLSWSISSVSTTTGSSSS